jgi:hypothetical protein
MLQGVHFSHPFNEKLSPDMRNEDSNLSQVRLLPSRATETRLAKQRSSKPSLAAPSDSRPHPSVGLLRGIATSRAENPAILGPLVFF